MVYASVIGAVDFKACDGSARWWTGAHMKLRMVEDQLGLKVAELQTIRAIGVQAMTDLNPDADYRQKYAIKAVDGYTARSMPWFAAAIDQNVGTSRLDAIAEWYAVFAGDPEILKEMPGG